MNKIGRIIIWSLVIFISVVTATIILILTAISQTKDVADLKTLMYSRLNSFIIENDIRTKRFQVNNFNYIDPCKSDVQMFDVKTLDNRAYILARRDFIRIFSSISYEVYILSTEQISNIDSIVLNYSIENIGKFINDSMPSMDSNVWKYKKSKNFIELRCHGYYAYTFTI